MRLGDRGEEEHDEPDELRHEEPHAALRVDDVGEPEGAREDHDADHREQHEDLVADHLRRGAQAPEQRVIVVRCPAGERDAVHRKTGHREEEQQRDVEVRDREPRRERHDREAEQHRDRDDRGRDDEHRLVGERRYPILFQEDLDHVRERLKDAERSSAIRAVTVLPPREQPPLDPRQERRGDEKREEQHDDEEEHRDDAHRTSPAVSLRLILAVSAATNGMPGRPTGTPSVPEARPGTTRTGSASEISPSSISAVMPSTMPRASASAGPSTTHGSGMRSPTGGDSAASSSLPKTSASGTTRSA